MNQKKILILGGGIMQIPSIRCAKQSGWFVILADGNEKAPGIGLADAFEHVDLKDREGMTEVAEKWSRQKGLNGVFTAGTDFSTTVAWVCDKLGLPGIPYETAMKASDKELMRKCFYDNLVPSPAFEVYREGEFRSPGETGLSFPLVVKPVDSMGARGTRRVNEPREFEPALKAGLQHSRSHRVIVEDYIEGPEFSIDAIVYDGSITICGVADRHIFFPPYFIEMGHTIPSSFEPEVLDEVCKVFIQGVRAIGITAGAAKGDIKLSPDGPVVGEIAARLSGGYMSGWTFPYHSGVEVTQAALNISVGEPPGDLSLRQDNVSAERAIISIPGIIQSAEGSSKAQRISGVKDLFCAASPGDTVHFPVNNVQKWGNVISCADNREASVKAAEQGCAMVSIILEPGSVETLRFLLGRESPWAPDAYELQVKENKEALQAMIPASGRYTAVPVRILSLPRQNKEQGIDWNHIPFQQGLEKVCSLTGVGFAAAPAVDDGAGILGKIFWKAFLRGGYQGGAWLVETMRKIEEENRDMERFIMQWA